MAKDTKPIVSVNSFDKLDIRIGRVIDVSLETRTHRPTYKKTIDFGKFGTRVSYGRFRCTPLRKSKTGWCWAF
jgi:tRNA-binding protein